MTASDWIRLAIVIAAACLAVWAAIDSTRSARLARANLRVTQGNTRQVIGGTGLMQINAIKARQLRGK